jgi:glycerol kinase
MHYIIAVDQGTTSSRAIIFDRNSQIISIAQREFPQIFPKPGWVEHDPRDIWDTQAGVISEALSRAALTPEQIAAIGITNQRETTVIWDRETGEPIYNAIVWQDRRTAEVCDLLKESGIQEIVRSRTGLLLDAYFSATKISWILDHVPDARARAERGELAFGTIDSWLIWKMTEGAVHVTDLSNASRTLLCDIHRGEWSQELLNIFRIPAALLPKIVESSERVGSYLGVPIAGIAGDQQAALFGQCCFQPGMVKNTYGTGCFMLMQTGEKAIASAHNLLSTVAWRIGGVTNYALEGSVFIGGAVVQWLRDGLKIIKTTEEFEPLVASVPDNGGVYLVPAFAGLGAPHWDQYARGTIVGLTRGSSSGHVARAAMESVAFQVADLLHAMESDSGIRLQELRVDGGGSRNNLLMQFQSDLLNIPVLRPRIEETTALGAAYLAGLAVGYWNSKEELGGEWDSSETFNPKLPADSRQTLVSEWSRALERAKGWVER